MHIAYIIKYIKWYFFQICIRIDSLEVGMERERKSKREK